MMRALLILLVLTGLSLWGYRAWTRSQFVPAAEVAAGIQARLADVRAGQRSQPVTTPEEQAELERTLRAAGVFDNAIDGELDATLQNALSKRWEEDEWSSLTPEEQALIAHHPPVRTALADWRADDSFANEPDGDAGSLSLQFQLVWLGEDVDSRDGADVDFGQSLIDALETVAGLYSTQDQISWTEGSRVLVWLEPRLRAKLGTLDGASRNRLEALALVLQERLPDRKQFLVQTQIDELEGALPMAAATGRDAPEVVNNLHNYIQALDSCIPPLMAVVDMPSSTDHEASQRQEEITRLAAEFDELPLGPRLLAAVCVGTVQAADACHESVAAIHRTLGL